MHVLAVLVVLFVFIVAVVGSMFSATVYKRGGDPWKNFPRSPYTPPNWLFSVMWSFLYCVIAYSWYTIANLASLGEVEAALIGVTRNKLIALNVLLFVNMALNMSWPFVYLGLRNARLSLVVLVFMVLSLIPVLYILTTIKGKVVELVFLSIYLCWLLFASLLNAYSALENL